MKTAKTLTRIAVASFAACTIGSAAQADFTHYDFTYTGTNGVGATGSLEIVGGYAVSGVCNVFGTGLMDGSYNLFTGGTTSPSGAFWYDNQVNPSGPNYLPGNGLLFMTGLGQELNIFSWGPGDYSMWGWFNNAGTPYGNGYSYIPMDDHGQFEMTKTPAPGALALLGMAGVFGTRRRRA